MRKRKSTFLKNDNVIAYNKDHACAPQRKQLNLLLTGCNGFLKHFDFNLS